MIDKSAIFVVSKQISEEALDVLLRRHFFQLGRYFLHAERDLKKTFTLANMRRVRYLLVLQCWSGISFQVRETPDPILWSAILTNLNVLRIVSQQHQENGGPNYDHSPHQYCKEDWIKWQRTFFEFIRQHRSGETVVEIDDNGSMETELLAEDCISGAFRTVICRISGDIIHRPGPFSVQSGF